MAFTQTQPVEQIQLARAEQELIKELVVRFRNSLDILTEPSYNRLSRQCNTILKRLR